MEKDTFSDGSGFFLENSTLYALIILHTDGVIKKVNKAACTLFGYKEDEIIGKHFSLLFPLSAQQQRLPEQELDEALSRGYARSNGWLVTKEGNPLWANGELSIIKDHTGRTVSIAKLIHDFTEKKALENELLDAYSFTEGVIDTMKEALVVLDEQSQVLLANHCFYKMFRVSASETIGKPLFELGNGQWNIPELKELLANVLPNQRPFGNFEVDHQFPRIGRRVILLNARQLYLQGKAKQRILLVLEDQTMQKDMVISKDDFISMAAHELKTPLTSLRAYNQIIQSLLKKSDSRTALMYIHKMEAQFDRLNKLIFDLLDVSRISSGKLEFTTAPFLLDDLVRDIVSALQPAFPSHLIEIQGKTSYHVIGDRERTGHVITNFIINGIKYSPGADRLIITLEEGADQNILGVTDFGVGIDPKHQSKIFERYYRIAEGEDRPHAGLGIGLYVSAHIIERLQGNIWVRSKPGKGSTFSFSLPVYQTNHYEENNRR